MRTYLDHVGMKGYRYARIYRVAKDAVLVERWVNGRPKRKTFPDVKAAKAFARRWYDLGSEVAAVRLGLRALLDRYIETMSDQRDWRPKTLLLRRAEQKSIEAVLTPDLDVSRLTPAHLDDLWRGLTRMGMAPSQVQRRCQFLKQVAQWGHSRDLVPHAKLAGWTSPQVATPEVAEYAPAEVEAMLGWLRQEPRGIRAHSAFLLASSHGLRANALLHLRWEDVDWTTARLTMQAAHDKTKRTWSRPLTFEGYAALLTMRDYQTSRGIESPWVFHGARDSQRPYTYGALWLQVLAAERGAGIPHQGRRALHGARRHAVNAARQETGDAALGMMWVGDRDMKQAVSYVRSREDELEAIADAQQPSRNRIPNVGAAVPILGIGASGGVATTYEVGGEPAMGLEPMTPWCDLAAKRGEITRPEGFNSVKLDEVTTQTGRNPLPNRTPTVFRISHD